ncbi:hypothetical protein K8R66_01980 [bacterium]|nr:hypothetical protein [bacterium]
MFKKNSLISDLYYKLSKNSKLIYKKIKSLLSFSHISDEKLIFNLSNKKFPNTIQLKQLKHFVSKKEKKIVYIAILFIIISFFWLSIRLVWNKLVDVPTYGGEYTEALVGSIQYINPILNQSNDADRDISRLVFSAIFKVNYNGELENDLIQGYELSDDKRIYTFSLKENIFWHDGEKFIADDIGFTLAAIQNLDFNSPLYKTFQGVGFEKISDNSFKLILSEPFSPFLSTLTFGILPAHLWEIIIPKNASLTELNKKPIGTGPFKYKSFKKGSNGNIKQYTLERFEDYYDKKAYLKEISFRLFEDLEFALEALKANRDDGVNFVNKENLSRIKESKDFDVY